MKSNITLICLMVLIATSACSPYLKTSVSDLVPEELELELIFQEEYGLSENFLFKFEGEISNDVLSGFPIRKNLSDGYRISPWHIPNSNERSDLLSFLNMGTGVMEVGKLVIDRVHSEEEFLITIIYKENHAPLGEKEFFEGNWMDLGIIFPESKELAYFNYGRF